MKTILLIGYDNNDTFSMLENDFNFIRYKVEDDDLQGNEQYLLFLKIINSVDIAIVNFNRKIFSENEGILLHLAYTKFTPIFGVGHKIWNNNNNIIQHFVSRTFQDCETLAEHLRDYYLI